MTATTSNEIGAGRLVTAFAASDPATGPPSDILPGPDTARDGDRPTYRRDIEAALARIERAIAGVMLGLRDGLARRQTVRELRLLGRARLADIGIEPDRIEHAVDAMSASRRNGTAMRGGRSRPRSE